MIGFRHAWIALAMTCAATPGRAAEGGEGHGACKTILDACRTAGFKKGEHKDGKGLFADCLEPILKGQSVPGVTAAATDVAACNEKKAHKGKKP